ncbi:hypothetical protein K0A96_00690 [Patescibacteria group bacterium]|nr:hypothetical protein [Patescibacteria group bacterium]
MEQTFNWKRLLITIGIVILTAGVVGGTTWYVMDSNSKGEKELLNQRLSDLENQLSQNREDNLESIEFEKESESIENNFVILNSAKSGEKYGAFELLEIKAFTDENKNLGANVSIPFGPQNYFLKFSGETTIKATYKYEKGPNIINGEYLMFTINDSESLEKIPTINKNNVMSFMATNIAEALKVLGINSTGSSEVSVKIKDFVLQGYPSEVVNTATVIK